MTDPKPPRNPFEDEAGSAIRKLALPDVIEGRYRVLARLGAGAMGIVLRAEDLFLQRPVAIKVVDPDPQVVERFIKEAQALAQVRHENVVQVYAFGPLETSYYLAMELVTGEPLETVVDRLTAAGKTLDLGRALTILRAIARGLEAVHARKLVHRDVKPGNIILEAETDRPVLIDFGLARRRSQSSPKLSITGGTPSYMAPEQARDPDGRRVTARTDLYAFACTAFEVMTGRPVFEGDDVYTVLLAHLNDPPRRLSAVNPALAAADDVLLRALAKDPADRFASVAEMMTALEEALGRPSLLPGPIAVPPSRRSRTGDETLTETTGPVTTSSAVVPSGRPATLVLATDSGLRRSLVRNTTQLLKNSALDLPCVAVETPAEAERLIHDGSAFDIVLIDEESAADRLVPLVTLARQRPSAEVIIVSRDLPATAARLGATRVRHLVPKPVNVHVLAAVLGRLERVKSAVK